MITAGNRPLQTPRPSVRRLSDKEDTVVGRTTLRKKCETTLSSTAGLSLVETIVAAAILAIAALILVSFVYTLTGVGKQSSDLSEADATLTETIALEPDGAGKTSTPMSITLGNNTGMTIDTTHNTYELNNGQNNEQFSTFDYNSSSSTSTP
jgi:type II secretory pathway pseudopilin PulG